MKVVAAMWRGSPVVGRYWREPRFWLWWWRYRLPHEVKLAVGLLAVGGLGVAGFFAAAGFGGEPSGESVVLPETLTIERIVTLEGGERTVVRPVRIVRRVTERSSVLGTAVELRTITTPGRTERQLVPVVRRDLVTVAGRPRTIVETRGGQTRTSVVTRERVVTNERTVERTVVVPETTTRVVTTVVPVTQTLRSTDTVVVTETVSEPVTVTDEQPVTVTVTVTVKKD
jgi:hypothetical protein